MKIEIDLNELENSQINIILAKNKVVVEPEQKKTPNHAISEQKNLCSTEEKVVEKASYNSSKRGRPRKTIERRNIPYRDAILKLVSNTAKRFTFDDFVAAINPDMPLSERKKVIDEINRLVQEHHLRIAGRHPVSNEVVYCNPEY